MNVQNRDVNTYHFIRNTGLDLRALLVSALTDGQPVVLTRDDEQGTVSSHIGVPTTVTMERVSMRTVDGGLFRCPLWQVERCALIGEGAWAA